MKGGTHFPQSAGQGSPFASVRRIIEVRENDPRDRGAMPLDEADVVEQGRIWAYRCPALAQYLVQLGNAWIEELVAEGADPADAEEHVRDCLPPTVWAAAKEATSRGE